MVELLVVIGLAIVLNALIYGAVSKALDSAKRTQCISNLRACGLGIFTCAAENNNSLVLPWASAASKDLADFPQLQNHPQSGKTWYEYLVGAGYLSMDVVICPSFSPYKPKNAVWGQTYGMRRSDSKTRYDAIRVAAIETPSKYLLLSDSSRPADNPPHQWYYITWPGNDSDKIHFRHQGKANALFLDGSVRSSTPEEILELNDGWQEKVFDRSM